LLFEQLGEFWTKRKADFKMAETTRKLHKAFAAYAGDLTILEEKTDPGEGFRTGAASN